MNRIIYIKKKQKNNTKYTFCVNKCNIIAEGFSFIYLVFGLVRLRSSGLVYGLVRCTHWAQVFTRTRGGCDNQRCHNKTPREEMRPGTWMTSCLEALGIWGIRKKAVSLDSIPEDGRRFLVSPWRDQLVSTKCAVCGEVQMEKSAAKEIGSPLSPHVEKH